MLQDTVSQNRDVRQSQEPPHQNLRPEITLKVEIQFERNFHPCNVASPRRILQDVQHPVTLYPSAMFFVDRSIGTCSKMPKLLRDPRSEVLGSKSDLGPFSKKCIYKISKTDRHV